MAGPITMGAWAVFLILAQVPAGAAAPATSPPNEFGLPSDAEAKSVAAAWPDTPPEARPADAKEEFRTRVRDAVSEVKAIDYDLDRWAGQLGGGVEPAFNYVKDRVRFEAYPGAFRGAAGTYRDRAGNAADRSLLLAQLLKAKGIAVRFAAGRLDTAAAEKLYDRLFELAAATPDGRAPGDTDFTRRVRTRAARDYAMISQALGPDLPDGGRPTRAEVLEEIAAGHTWVQARVGDRWVDLDPSFADAAPGKSYCGARLIVSALPESAHQRLTIRVTAERLEGGRLRSETALEFTRPVPGLAERQIFLVHSAVEGQAGLGQAIAGTPGDQWKPVLWIDGEVFAGKSISFAGGAGADLPRKSIGFANALDALDAPAAPATAATGPRFVAEYLELVLTRPGVKQPHTVRRILSDRAGAAWRIMRGERVSATRAADGSPAARSGGTLFRGAA